MGRRRPLSTVQPPATRRPLADDDRVTLPATAAATRSLTAPVAGDFTFSAGVAGDLREVLRSGVLPGWADEATGFTVCADLDSTFTARMVSAIARDAASDDAAVWPMPPGVEVHLRIARLGAVSAIYASTGG